MTNKTNTSKAIATAYRYSIRYKTGEAPRLARLTRQEYENKTCDETVKFFKDFGSCSFKYLGGYCYQFKAKNTHLNETITERFYNTLPELIKGEKLTLHELQPNEEERAKSFYNKAHIIYTSDNACELGLESYGELVASFECARGIATHGYFSPTTARHLKSYINRKYLQYTIAPEVTKKNLENNKFYYFKQF